MTKYLKEIIQHLREKLSPGSTMGLLFITESEMVQNK